MKSFGREIPDDSPLAKRIKQQYPDIDDCNSGGAAAKPKRSGRAPLVGEAQNPAGLVNLPLPIHCRIIRVYTGREQPYDDDNLSGGCKQLRDAIAAILGLKGDSAKDGIAFSYAEEKGEEAQTIIEFYQPTEEANAKPIPQKPATDHR